MSWIHSPSSGLLQGLGHFSICTLCSTLSLTSKPRQDLLHNHCWFWWSCHGTSISKMLGSSVVAGLHFHQQPLIGSLHGAKSWLLCTTGPYTALEATPSLMDSPILSQYQASTALHAFKSAIWVTLTLPSSAAIMRYNLGNFWNSGNTTENISLQWHWLFLINNHNISASADQQPIVSVRQKFCFSVSSL
jgi:hypothetical protein